MFELVIPQFIKMLGNVQQYLDKAQQHAELKKYDVNVLLTTRLTPDQYPFLKQVQIVCDGAKGAAARLSGQTAPVHEDTEKTVEELRKRVEKTVAYLKTFSAEDFSGWKERQVDIFWAPGKWLPGFEYLTQIAVPNFYFHLTTAYAVLRHAGVDVGKMDYLGDVKFRDKAY